MILNGDSTTPRPAVELVQIPLPVHSVIVCGRVTFTSSRPVSLKIRKLNSKFPRLRLDSQFSDAQRQERKLTRSDSRFVSIGL